MIWRQKKIILKCFIKKVMVEIKFQKKNWTWLKICLLSLKGTEAISMNLIWKTAMLMIDDPGACQNLSVGIHYVLK